MKMIMFYTLEKFGCGFFPLVKKPPHETTFVENNYIFLPTEIESPQKEVQQAPLRRCVTKANVNQT